MFASATAFKGGAAAGNIYRRIGVETLAATATPHQLVLMLFDGFRDAVAQARGAMIDRQYEAKGKAIGRAIGIVGEGLRGGLNLEAGGKLAADLEALYSYVCLRLTHANLHNDLAALDECERLLQPLRAAWIAIGPQADATPH
jgi:flagellar secretion chaperone FliS